jgi:hypothetical protein
MDELSKLNQLLKHWIDHNKDHVSNYNEWADKADVMGKHKLSETLRRIADESDKLEALFREAIDSIDR